MSKDNLGDRMKEYESVQTEIRLDPALPIYARLDGQSFSRFTRNFERPFDRNMHQWMCATTAHLIRVTNAQIGYTQSDEISLVWLQSSPDSQIWFDGKLQKMVSSLASKATSFFMQQLIVADRMDLAAASPSFDCRLFQLPSLDEAANAFLWRELDAQKNAISMAAHTMFSTKQLHGKSGAEKKQMMQEVGVFFDSYCDEFKRGSFMRREKYDLATGQAIPPKQLSADDVTIRSRIVRVDMPNFVDVGNRVDVIFHNATPAQRHNWIEP